MYFLEWLVIRATRLSPRSGGVVLLFFRPLDLAGRKRCSSIGIVDRFVLKLEGFPIILSPPLVTPRLHLLSLCLLLSFSLPAM